MAKPPLLEAKRDRWLPSAIAAVAMHLAIPLLAMVAPPPSSGRDRLAPIDAQELVEVDVTVVTPPPPQAGEQPSAETEPFAADRRSAKIDRSRDPRPASDRGPDPETPPTGEPAAESVGPPSPAPSTGGYDGPTTDGSDVVFAPGVGGTPVWSLPGVLPPGERSRPAPTAPAPQASTDRDVAGSVLRGTMRGKDKALGLDLPAAGTVASAVAEGVRGSDAPGVGRATFEVKVGPKGQILSVRVLSSSTGTTQAWQRAADLAKSRLAAAKLAMTGEFAAGATIFVDITSVLQLPAGGTGGVIPEGPPPGSVGGGFAFDLSNIGAHAARLVKSTFRAVPAR